MTKADQFRTGCTVAGALAVSVILTGCAGSPTYGTGKTANAQLVDDLTKIVSIAPQQKKSERAYAPRPTIVKPPESATLPAPQASLSSGDNPQWLESPEETRARLRDDAVKKRDSGYRSPLASSQDNISPEQWEKFREAKAQQRGLSSTRSNLTDPPMVYREPSDTAPIDELGEPEHVKERRREKAARKEKGFKIGNLWPF